MKPTIQLTTASLQVGIVEDEGEPPEQCKCGAPFFKGRLILVGDNHRLCWMCGEEIVRRHVSAQQVTAYYIPHT